MMGNTVYLQSLPTRYSRFLLVFLFCPVQFSLGSAMCYWKNKICRLKGSQNVKQPLAFIKTTYYFKNRWNFSTLGPDWVVSGTGGWWSLHMGFLAWYWSSSEVHSVKSEDVQRHIYQWQLLETMPVDWKRLNSTQIIWCLKDCSTSFSPFRNHCPHVIEFCFLLSPVLCFWILVSR